MKMKSSAEFQSVDSTRAVILIYGTGIQKIKPKGVYETYLCTKDYGFHHRLRSNCIVIPNKLQTLVDSKKFEEL